MPFTVSGTAVDGKNYRLMTPNPLTIKAGAPRRITLALIDDKLYEDNKTIIVTLGTPVTAILSSLSSHLLTVV